jgi:hypothetical protein
MILPLIFKIWMYNNCLKIHILKQQAADFRLVFILMEIINFEVTWILNAIKNAVYSRYKTILWCIYKIIFSYIYQFIYPKFRQIRGSLFV